MATSRRFRRGAVAAVAAALVLTPGTAFGAPGDGDRVTIPNKKEIAREVTAGFVNTTKWFVELEGEPTSTGGNRAKIDRGHKQLEADAKREGATVTRTFDSLFNGATVEADADTAQALAELPEVKAIFPVIPVAVPESQKSDPAMFTAGKMTGVDIARSELGLTGKGIKVGVIDSGIDYDHPDFGGSGTNGTTTFPTARVAYGYDFVGDAYNADPNDANFNPVPKPDAMPDDCQGHGTHVAGIVGGNGKITGVAPDVTLGAYRVFGCDGSTDTDIILAALERAEADGMDVVNMSLGAAFESWQEYPTGTASDRLVRNGIVVVNAAGNEGDYFTQAVGAPGVARDAIGVASYDNVSVRMSEMLFTPATGEPISAGYLTSTGSPDITDAVNGTAVSAMTDPFGCTAGGDVTGKIAIVSRGTCSFHDKAVAAQASGAKALVIYNNVPGFINATVEGATEITIPVVTIGQSEGAAIVAALPGGVTGALTGEEVQTPNPLGGRISDFSSWGLSADLTLKPDLGAPGGSIYSTYPLEKGGHLSNSGTSMAAPHVAGAVALMLQENPDLTPAEVLTRLQNTAAPSLNPELLALQEPMELLDAAHRQGAGLIQVDKAILADSLVTPAKISAGESADGPFTQKLTISNATEEAVTWTLSHEDALSTYNDAATLQNYGELVFEESRVTFSAPTVTVPAGGTATVDVTVQPAADSLEGTQYSGFVVLTDSEGTTVDVPFAGMTGDYGNMLLFASAFPLSADESLPIPALAVINECDAWEEQQCVDSSVDFDLAKNMQVYKGNGDNPSVLLHLAYPVRSLKLEAIPVKAGKPVESGAREVFTMDYKGRTADLDLYSWDGRLKNDKGLMADAPAGQYVLRFTAEEPDGDGGTQSWTSKVCQLRVTPPPPSVEPTPTKPVPTKPVPTQKPIVPDVYNTPGYHTVNGRRWHTACEKYSQTTRCSTQIWATTVAYTGGRFVATNGWVFNNLTYLPGMTRQQWGSNPLANNTSWTAADGRKWRTECDTAATGRGGCRSYITADVIAASKKADGTYAYRWERKEILNNIVRFKNS